MKKAVITVHDEVWAVISGLEPPDLQYLINKFALHVDGYMWMPLYKLGRWDGKVKFVSDSGKVYQRLLPEICTIIEGWGYDINLNDHRLPVNQIVGRVDKDWFLRKQPEMKLKVELRPYQVDAVNACLDNQSGFVEAATGAGKCVDGKTPINIRVSKLIRDKLNASLE